MDSLNKRKIIFVNDGEEFSVVIKMSPSLYDPQGSIAAIAQTFRIVANSHGPVLVLVPLTNAPVLLSDSRLLKGEEA